MTGYGHPVRGVFKEHPEDEKEGVLKPGDFIFSSYEDNEKFRNISYAPIYVGDEKVVRAANLRRE